MATKVTVSMQGLSSNLTDDQQIYMNEPIEIHATFTDFSSILEYPDRTHIIRYIDENSIESFWKFNSTLGLWVEIVGISIQNVGDGHTHLNKIGLDKIEDVPNTEGVWVLKTLIDETTEWDSFINQIPDQPDQLNNYYLTKDEDGILVWIALNDIPTIDENFGSEPKVLIGRSDGTILWGGDKFPSQSFIYDNSRYVMEYDENNPHSDLADNFSGESFSNGEKFILYTLTGTDTYDSENDQILLFINGFIYNGVYNDWSGTYVYNSIEKQILVRIVDEPENGLYYDSGDKANLLLVKNTASGVTTRLSTLETFLDGINETTIVEYISNQDIILSDSVSALTSTVNTKAPSIDLDSTNSRVTNLEENVRNLKITATGDSQVSAINPAITLVREDGNYIGIDSQGQDDIELISTVRTTSALPLQDISLYVDDILVTGTNTGSDLSYLVDNPQLDLTAIDLDNGNYRITFTVDPSVFSGSGDGALFNETIEYECRMTYYIDVDTMATESISDNISLTIKKKAYIGYSDSADNIYNLISQEDDESIRVRTFFAVLNEISELKYNPNNGAGKIVYIVFPDDNDIELVWNSDFGDIFIAEVINGSIVPETKYEYGTITLETYINIPDYNILKYNINKKLDAVNTFTATVI